MGTNTADRQLDTCAHCGDGFERGVRYPVTTAEDPEGNVQLYSFCDKGCQESWEDENL